MSMTREEAIKFAEHAVNITDIPEVKAFYRLASAALRPVSREQVEKVWRGEWEWFDEIVGTPIDGYEREWGWWCSKCKVVLPDDFDDPGNPPGMVFCPWCGSPMTDKAVDMVMDRLEVLKDGKDN